MANPSVQSPWLRRLRRPRRPPRSPAQWGCSTATPRW